VSLRRRYEVVLELTNHVLITVLVKSDFTTPFALRSCVIWAFPARQGKEGD